MNAVDRLISQRIKTAEANIEIARQRIEALKELIKVETKYVNKLKTKLSK